MKGSVCLSLLIHACVGVRTYAFGMSSRTIFQSGSVKMIFESRCNPPHLLIQSVPDSGPITLQDISSVTNETEKLLNAKLQFKTTWDLRHCPVPTASVVLKCMAWAIAHKRQLDAQNTRTAIILNPNSKSVLAVVNTVLRMFGPRCPVRVTNDQRDADHFMTNQSLASGWSTTISEGTASTRAPSPSPSARPVDPNPPSPRSVA
jgi:hypothetical protein